MLIPPIRQISLLTDFGLQDIYVGVMKGVIDRIAPQVKVLDLCHHIPPGEITVASLMLNAAVPYFSPETLYLCVVDPGVGSKRRILYVQSALGHFLAPDNGLLSSVLQLSNDYRCWEVTNREFMLPQSSNTFHGRDIFAPVAAHLSLGIPANTLGSPLTDPLLIETPQAKAQSSLVEGEIVYIDGFGNICSNIPAGFSSSIKSMQFPEKLLEFEGPVASSYASREPGEALIIVNSFSYMELAINRGNAAETYQLTRGQKVSATLDTIEDHHQSERVQ